MKQVIDFFARLLDTGDWPPRWHCGKWTGFHGWLYIISDLLIWGAYFAIPVIIIRYITRQRQQRFIKLYFLFAAFILACGATHFLDAIMFWIPVYRLNALLRAVTAIVSWATVFSLIRLLPYASRLKPPEALEQEVEIRRGVEKDMHEKTRELEENRQLFKNVFDHSAVGVALVSPEGKWLNVNQAICDMLGYTREEMLKCSFQDITHPDDLATDLAYVEQMLTRQRETYQMEKRYIRKDGSHLWVLLSVSLTWSEEKPAFFISQLTDITMKKRLRMEVEKKNAELEAHIVKINEFNRIVAHNLRGPASTLINMADFLEKNPNEEDRNFLLSKVKDTSMLIVHTLNDLKDLLEIQIRQEQQSVPYGFNDALANSLQLLDGEMQGATPIINARFDIREVFFPKAYLDSIFYNLLSNALKYRSKDRTPVIDIATTQHEGYILLTIKDNGIGIDMQKHAQDLFKYKKVFHKGYDSNGVGLFLTRAQLEANNARIEVDSIVNDGTLFRIYFKKQEII